MVATNFNLIGGLDLKTPGIVEKSNSPKALTNLEFSSKGLSLRSRKGILPSGQVGDFIGLHTYNYTDAITGANTEEMIAMNQRLWKSATTSFTITRVAGAGTWRYEKTVESGVHRFKIYDGTTLVLNYSLGTGLGEYTNGMVRIWDLINQINTNTGGLYTATLPPRSGQVNGNQSGVRSILLVAGHNFAVNDVAVFIDTDSNRFDARRVISITGANTIDFDTGSSTVGVLTGEVLGPAGVAAAAISPVTLNSNTAAAQTINFPYWEHVPSPYSRPALGVGHGGSDHNPFEKYYTTRKNSTFVPPSFVNAGNACHIFTNARGATGKRPWEDYPMKYDGQACYRSGVPSFISPATVIDSGAAGNPDGAYKYSFRYIYTDARGVSFTGNPSHFYTTYSVTVVTNSILLSLRHPIFAVPAEDLIVIPAPGGGPWVTITLTAGHGLNIGDVVAVRDSAVGSYPMLRTITATTATTATISGANITSITGDYIIRNPSLGFNSVSTEVTNGQAGVGSSGAPLLCTNSFSFQIGDTVYLHDRLRTKYVTRKLTGITATGVYWDTSVEETISTSAGVSVPPVDDPNMSKNFRIQIFRTKAGGNKFYFVNEIPLPLSRLAGAGAYLDDAADTSLIEEMTDVPEIGLEHDIPPKGSFGCVHQNLLMISGDPANPNQLAFSLPDNIEAFPLATNFTEIPSNIQGGLTAIASDTEAQLAVFKENSYYEIQGDFINNAFSIHTVNEGDVGVVSHASLRRVNGSLIGLSKIGFVRISNGILNRIASEISPAIIQRLTVANQLNYKAAIGSLDWPNRRYRCYVPASVGFNSGGSTAQAVMFVYDYENDRWFDWTYASSLEPSGGMTVYNNNHYHLSKSYGGTNNSNFPGQVFSDLNLDPTNASIGDSYVDNTLGISRVIKVLVTCDDPSTDKLYLRLKIFSMYEPYEEDQFTASTLTVTTYKNFQEGVADTTFTLSFNDILTYEQYQHLPTTVARALLFSITNSTVKVSPHITGVQVIVAEPFVSDDTAS